MKAAVRLLPHGLTYLVAETESTAEADLARRLAHQYGGKHLTLRCREAGGQVVLGLEPMPADLPKEPPVHEAAPQMVMRLALDASPDVHGVRYLREPAGKGTVGVAIAGKDGRTSPELDEQVHAYLVRRLPPHLKVVVQSDIGVGSYSAAPELAVERRYVPPSRDGVGEVTVTLQGIEHVAPEPAAAPLDLWPVIKLGRRVRLHSTGKPGVITHVHCEEGVGTDGVATLTIDFDWDAKAGA